MFKWVVGGALGASAAMGNAGELMKKFKKGRGVAGNIGDVNSGIQGAEHLLARGEV